MSALGDERVPDQGSGDGRRTHQFFRITLELRRQSGFSILQLGESEAATFHRLPRLAHKDPFDRLIIWQSISQKLTLISKGRSFADYKKLGLKVLW